MPTDPKIIEIEKRFDEMFVVKSKAELEHDFVAFDNKEEQTYEFWNAYKIKSFYSQEITKLLSQKEKEIKEEIKEWAKSRKFLQVPTHPISLMWRKKYNNLLTDLLSFLEKGK